LEKKKISKFANKEKMAIGVCNDISKKIGMEPMYIRGGLFATSVFINPLVAIGIYGAGLAYTKWKK
jgi:phage shock protein PspC (stress-responsive transcriptional regulator)